jgi:hypothetical protein
MFKKIGGRIRNWWKSDADPDRTPKQFTPKVHPSEQLEKPDRIQFPAITNRHIYINYGFNRKERRRLEALGRKGLLTKIDKMMLKANPKNVPCEVKRFRVGARQKIVKLMKTNNPLYGVNE